MSILIKGMEMPTSCYKCNMRRRDGMDIVCPVAHERFHVADVNILEYRLDNCPLVPVPPHGRLIDADELKKVVASAKHMDADIYDGRLFYSDHLCVGADYDDVCKAIDETPTVIPADESDMDSFIRVFEEDDEEDGMDSFIRILKD